jgi:putative DNA primase/helicase
VLAATEDYLQSADAIPLWIEECCVFGPNETMTKAKAFDSWKAWAEASNEFVGDKDRLFDRIRPLHGVNEDRFGKNRDRGFRGIGLRPKMVHGD